MRAVDFSDFRRCYLTVASRQQIEKFIAEPIRYRLSSNTFFTGLQNNFLSDVLKQRVDSLVDLRLFLFLDLGILCLEALCELTLLLPKVVVYLIDKRVMVLTPINRDRI